MLPYPLGLSVVKMPTGVKKKMQKKMHPKARVHDSQKQPFTAEVAESAESAEVKVHRGNPNHWMPGSSPSMTTF